MKHIFIINPVAGKKDSSQRIYDMADRLRREHGQEVECILTRRQGHATEIARRLCESGDILQPGIRLPGSITRGDLVAVCTTGAYNYSMVSRYNRLPAPPVVMLSGGTSRVAVRRETAEDLIRLDV